MSPGGPAAWISTFADLMNLLLCFFVMLFAFSDINAEKFEKVTISLSNSFGVFQGGGSSVGAGELISAGMSQLSKLDEYYSRMGQTSVKAGINPDGQSNTSNPVDTKSGNQGSSDTQDPENDTGTSSFESSGNSEQMELEEAVTKVNQEMAASNEKMYDQISDLNEQYNLGDYVELSIDKNNKFVQLTLNGSVLFNSGDAQMKKEALPILDKISHILKRFKDCNIEITGHTDNVPVSSSEFKDNNWLSSARALNAAEYLIDQCNIEPAKLKYSGRGEYEPIISNATPEGRAKNRRIEIKIYNEISSE
jgi:Flagellar motor protein